jgi:tRNA (guanine10-N2)-dimethyltransferase
MFICILGRQPALGLAELEAVFGTAHMRPFGKEAATLDVSASTIQHKNLGGVIKVAEIISSLPAAPWPTTSRKLLEVLAGYLTNQPEGKINFGLSAYGLQVTARQLNDLGLQLKKNLKTASRSVRTVLSTTPVLNSAQVLHNNLDRGTNAEIVLVSDGHTIHVAKTRSIQNVDSYSKRDFERPKRDARVGMLPPKLAQIMLNLAQPPTDSTVLDPFCGTGVVLMEAALQGYSLAGSDINQQMIDYTAANLDWLQTNYHLKPLTLHLEAADATNHHWNDSLTTVVCETYLGRPLTALPDRPTLHDIINDCNTIIRKFLENLLPQLASTARCCIAVPAWATHGSFIHLPLVDYLEEIGYNRVRFSYARLEELIYHRPEQVVARELLVLTRRKE